MKNDTNSLLKKQIGEKIKTIRTFKKFSRQKIADALDMSVSNYGYIESGKVDMSITCLADIAKIFEMSLEELLNLKEKNVLNFHGVQNDGCHNYQITSLSTELHEMVLNNELEKAQLLLNEREKEVNYLKEENARLKEMFDWIKLKDKLP